MPKAVAALLFVAVVLLSGPASGAITPGCGPALAALGQKISAPTLSYSARAGLIERAGAADPACSVAITALGKSVAETANPILRARGFLGPVGWYWNNIYFRVLAGSTPNMVLFGVPLFFAPVVLVGSLLAVLSGTKGAREASVRPRVDPHPGELTPVS